jgi:hypothetical protein
MRKFLLQTVKDIFLARKIACNRCKIFCSDRRGGGEEARH